MNSIVPDLSEKNYGMYESLILTPKLKYVLGRVENIVRIGTNAVFNSFLFQRCQKSEMCGKVNPF